MRAFGIYGGLAVVAVLIDQAIKYVVQTGMELYERIDLLPFLALFRTANTGISFSWLENAPVWQLVAIVLAVTAFIGWLSWRTPANQAAARAGFALIIAGALGNLIDRVAYGHVVDYILFHTTTWAFAVFNFADACISVGAALVVLQEIIEWRHGRNASKADAERR